MLKIKRLIVMGLDYACALLDSIPTWERDEHGNNVKCFGRFGCGMFQLAHRAGRLDERWGTQVLEGYTAGAS